MPTYQYSCTECGHFFEQFQSFSEDSLTECPQCQGRLRKVFNAVGVVFKGSGFYRTDSRSESRSSDGGDSGSGAKKEGAPAEKSTSGDTSPGKSSSGTSGSGTGGTGSGTGSGAAAAKSGSSTSAA